MTTELIIADTINPIALFTDNGVEPILEGIKTKARSFVPDISTDKGRKEIASIAYSVARSKTLLDDMGKALVADWKAKSAAVDAERKKIRDEMDALKDEVRKPLTEWENAEKDRVAQHEANIDRLSRSGVFDAEADTAAIKSRLKAVHAFHDGQAWQEFSVRAAIARDTVVADLTVRLEARQAYEAQQAELERLRREDQERKQREHEERLKAEAADKARREAEAEAKAEADRIRQEKEEAEERARTAEAARIAADEKAAADAKAAEDRAKQAEIDRIAAENKARADAEAAKLAADKRAKEEAEAAVQRERDRIAAEQKAEADAAAKREADKKHGAKVNNEVLAALVSAGLDDAMAKLVIEAIAQGKIPHVRISY